MFSEYLSNVQSITVLIIAMGLVRFPTCTAPYCPLKFLLRRAAKARLDRMCKHHGKRQNLNVPEWLQREWKNGDKNEISDVLLECNFSKDTNAPSISKHVWSVHQRTVLSYLFVYYQDFATCSHTLLLFVGGVYLYYADHRLEEAIHANQEGGGLVLRGRDEK